MTRKSITVLASAIWLVSCGKQPEESSTPPESADPKQASRKSPPSGPPDEALLDEDGRLLPSDEFVAGVRLPKGLTLYRQTERERIYRTDVPIKKVLAYFGPMLMTGKVDQMGEGAIYRRASVLGAEVNPTKVDVSVLKAGDLTRVSITELPPPQKFAPTVQETQTKVQRSWRMLD